MRFGCGLGAVWVRFGCGLGAVWVRFGCGLGTVWNRMHVMCIRITQKYDCHHEILRFSVFFVLAATMVICTSVFTYCINHSKAKTRRYQYPPQIGYRPSLEQHTTFKSSRQVDEYELCGEVLESELMPIIKPAGKETVLIK